MDSWVSYTTRTRATRLREAGSLTTQAQMHSVLSVSVSISISIVAPRRLGTETLRDHGREHEAIEQREQHEQVYVGHEGLHGERYHAAALCSGRDGGEGDEWGSSAARSARFVCGPNSKRTRARRHTPRAGTHKSPTNCCVFSMASGELPL